MMIPARSASPYPTDPPSAASTRAPTLGGSVFDQARLADALRRGRIQGAPPLPYPNDEMLIATVVALGMPRWSAEQVRYHPQLRLQYIRVWLDVRAAAHGNLAAKDRIDVIRASFAEMRAVELIADRPDMSIGLWER